MIKIKLLGGAREIGRSAVAVMYQGTCVLLDYGVLVNEKPGFPMHIAPRDVGAIVITHAHLDHSGAVPIFHIRGKTPVYGTRLTFELVRLLIKDFLRLSSYYLPYEFIDMESMLRSAVYLNYGELRRIGKLSFSLMDAGHIPGSAQVLLKMEKVVGLYTSDFNLVKTQLLQPATIANDELSFVVIESTYADEDHPNREWLERELVKRLAEVVERGGTALVPAFSVGRSQEILCILAQHDFPYPVVLDGMAREASQILARYLEFLRDPSLFMRAMKFPRWIRGKYDRRRAVEEPCVIVSPAGMLKGGAAVYYAQKIIRHPENAIFLVSYQVPGTPGHELLTKKRFVIEGSVERVQAEVERFDFSSHCGQKELCSFARSVRGTPLVITIHGAGGNCELLARLIREEAGLKAVAAKPGEIIRID